MPFPNPGPGRPYHTSTSSIEELYPDHFLGHHGADTERMDDDDLEVVFLGSCTPGSKSSSSSHRRRRGPRKSERKKAHPEPQPQVHNHENLFKRSTQHNETFELDDSIEAEEGDEGTCSVKDDSIVDGGSAMSIPDSESVMDSQTVILTDSEDEEDDDDEPIILDDSHDQDDSSKQGSTSGLGDSSSCDDPMSSGDAEDIKDITPPDVQANNMKKKLAEERRQQGNMFFKNQEYHKALEMYSDAIEAVSDDPTFYGNRSACYMMLRKFKDAANDARKALQLDPTFEKGYYRLVRSTLALGDVLGAESALRAMQTNLEVVPDTKSEEKKLVDLRCYFKDLEITKSRNDYRKVVYLCERALEIACGDVQLKMVKANSLLKLERFSEALDLCTEVLQADNMCVEGYFVRAVCFFCQDNTDKAMQFLKQALQLAPDNPMCIGLFRQIKKFKDLRNEAQTLFKSQKYSDSKKLYLESVQLLNSIGYTNKCTQSKMYMNLSLIALKLEETDEALKYVNKAIELNPSYLKAHIHRGSVHTAKEKFEDAVRDYEAAQKLDPGTDYKTYINDTKLAAKRAKRKDYYKILGVSKGASGDEVKKAYKKRALIHHPDRHSNASEEEKKEQESKFKELGEAYDVLSDKKKRDRYDNGFDVNDADLGSGASGYEMNSDLFNMFFTGGMPSSYSSGRPGFGGQFRQGSTYGGRSNYHPY